MAREIRIDLSDGSNNDDNKNSSARIVTYTVTCRYYAGNVTVIDETGQDPKLMCPHYSGGGQCGRDAHRFWGDYYICGIYRGMKG